MNHNYWLYEKELQYFAVVVLSVNYLHLKLNQGWFLTLIKTTLNCWLCDWKGHYDPATIDDKFSKGIYKDYVQALDPSKRFFFAVRYWWVFKYELN
jgi:carboxyl-terminal processing protease